jgi:Phosphoinositide phospholipase C, Ca2+-dependent
LDFSLLQSFAHHELSCCLQFFFRLVTQPAASKELLGSIESEILSVFPQDKIITPDSVKTALNLSPNTDITRILLQAPTQTSCPWPDLESLRGKIMFGLIFPDEATAELYRDLHPGQKGAVAWMVWDSFFVPEAVMYTAGGGLNLSIEGGTTPPTLPQNASTIVATLAKDISEKVKSGYLVRARADADTIEARLGYVGRAAAVLNSSASVVSTDYGMPTSVLPGINYSVKLYGNQPARCVNNAVLGSYTGAEVFCNSFGTPTAVPLSAAGGGGDGGGDGSSSAIVDDNNNGSNTRTVGSNSSTSNNTPSPFIEKSSPNGGTAAASSSSGDSSGGDSTSSDFQHLSSSAVGPAAISKVWLVCSTTLATALAFTLI